MAGVDDLAFSLNAVAQRLREAGETGLSRQLSKKISEAVEPVPERMRKGLAPRMPDRYAAVLDEDLDIRRRTSTRGDQARVEIVATTRGSKRRRIRRLDDGILWHPTFGNRRHGAYQDVTSGWFSREAEDSAPEVRDAISVALEEVAAAAAGKGIL